MGINSIEACTRVVHYPEPLNAQALCILKKPCSRVEHYPKSNNAQGLSTVLPTNSRSSRNIHMIPERSRNEDEPRRLHRVPARARQVPLTPVATLATDPTCSKCCNPCNYKSQPLRLWGNSPGGSTLATSFVAIWACSQGVRVTLSATYSQQLRVARKPNSTPRDFLMV